LKLVEFIEKYPRIARLIALAVAALLGYVRRMILAALDEDPPADER